MNTFKNGDKVYMPKISVKVFTIEDIGNDTYPLISYGQSFTSCGRQCTSDTTPSLVHATQENKDLLEKLYGVEFDNPPPRTRTVTFEMPETFDPRFGEGYWYITSSSDEICDYAVNYESGVDDARISRGVWRTEEEALQVAKAIFNIKRED